MILTFALFFRKSYPTLYSLSFMYYCLMGTLATIVVGILVSFITGTSKVHSSRIGSRCCFKKQRRINIDNSLEKQRMSETKSKHHRLAIDAEMPTIFFSIFH